MKRMAAMLMLTAVIMAATPVMTNATIEAMVSGGVQLPTIVRAIKTATKIEFFTGNQDYARLTNAGASNSAVDEIMKAIRYREYVGIDRSPVEPVLPIAVVAKPSVSSPVPVPPVPVASVAPVPVPAPVPISVAPLPAPVAATKAPWSPPAPAIIDPQPQPPAIRAARGPIARPRIVVQLSPEELAALCIRATKIIGDPMQEFAAQEEAHTVALLYNCAQSSSTIDPPQQVDYARVETDARAQSEPSYVAPSYTAGPAPSYTAAAPVPTCGRWCIFFQGLAQAIQDQQNGAYVYAGRPVAASRKPAAKKTKK